MLPVDDVANGVDSHLGLSKHLKRGGRGVQLQRLRPKVQDYGKGSPRSARLPASSGWRTVRSRERLDDLQAQDAIEPKRAKCIAGLAVPVVA